MNITRHRLSPYGEVVEDVLAALPTEEENAIPESEIAKRIPREIKHGPLASALARLTAGNRISAREVARLSGVKGRAVYRIYWRHKP